MKTFEKFDSTNIKSARVAIQEKLNELEALGLKIELGNISYSSDSFKTSVTVTVGAAGDKYAVQYRKYAKIYGLDENKVGTKVKKQDGKMVLFKGFIPNARTKIATYEYNSKLYRCDYSLLDLKKD